MSLNIKREETYRLAHELAQLTGESVTGPSPQRCRSGSFVYAGSEAPA